MAVDGWLLGGEMEMDHDLVATEHVARSSGFVLGGQRPGDWSAGHKRQDWTSGRLRLGKDNPFGNMRIADTAPLDRRRDRQNCRQCNKSRKFFCYSCRLPLPGLEAILPRVELPVRVEVVKHRQEVDGKSTAVHASLLAPGAVRIHTFPDIPSYSPSSTLLVFPGPRARGLSALLQEAGPGPGLPFTTVVFVDSTWSQCHGICQDPRWPWRHAAIVHPSPRLAQLPCVVLQPRWLHRPVLSCGPCLVLSCPDLTCPALSCPVLT
jgi:hypothetical protein